MNFKFYFSPKTKVLLDKITAYIETLSVEAYLVGGSLRDALLRRETRDIDLAVTGDALEVARQVASRLGGRYVLLDESNQVARVDLQTLPDNSAAITPPQKGNYHIDFATIRDSIENDLKRRDFTIDAMALNLKDWAKEYLPIIDPFSAREDLRRKLIRATGGRIFQDDPGRLLRAVRLAAEYNFNIEERTEALIREQGQLINQVARERVRDELCCLLSLPHSAHWLGYLDSLGLLTEVFPELAQTKGVTQPWEHYWDVFQHSLETVTEVEHLLQLSRQVDEVNRWLPPSLIEAGNFNEEISPGLKRVGLVKLAALLHDIAKPKTKTVDPDGRARFIGHTKEGELMVGDILRRLRFSNQETKLVQMMVAQHLRLWQMSQQELPTRRALYRFFRDTEGASFDIILLALADYLATSGPRLNLADWQEVNHLVEYILQWKEEQAVVSPPKLISGHDLINLFGLKPGPQIGEILEKVRETQGVGEIATREEALALAGQLIKSHNLLKY
jgi:poly(A) polymerase